MGYKRPSPNIYTVHTVYCNKSSNNTTPTHWNAFLKEIGLTHVSMSRIEIVNNKRWLLAKIKYGF